MHGACIHMCTCTHHEHTSTLNKRKEAVTKSGDRRKPLAELLAVKLMKSECKGGKGSGMEESEPSPGDLGTAQAELRGQGSLF